MVQMPVFYFTISVSYNRGKQTKSNKNAWGRYLFFHNYYSFYAFLLDIQPTFEFN